MGHRCGLVFDSKLRKLESQRYESVSPAKVREKPPANAQNRENGVWREGKFPSLAENAAQKRRWATFSEIYIPDNRNSPNQVLSLVKSLIKCFLGKINSLTSVNFIVISC